MQIEDVKKLASLARINMSEEEMDEIVKDFKPVLEYVDQIQEISGEESKENKDGGYYFIKNITREDEVENNDIEMNKDILANVPQTEDRFIKVKQIL